MEKKRLIYLVDCGLIPVFVCSACTGIGLHVAGHGASHAVWHNWALAHVVCSVLFTVGVVVHVKTHWGWYKSLFKYGRGKKSHVTIAVSVLFVIVALTGYVLLGVSGAGSAVGLWHYRIGWLAIALFCGHIIKRLPVLKKMGEREGRG